MIVYTWKDGKQLKDRNKIFYKFIKDNKFCHQIAVKNEMFESYVALEFITSNEILLIILILFSLLFLFLWYYCFIIKHILLFWNLNYRMKIYNILLSIKSDFIME